MKVKAPPRMSSIQWFVSIAAGAWLCFCCPKTRRAIFPMFTARFFVAVVAFGIALVLFCFCSSCTSR